MLRVYACVAYQHDLRLVVLAAVIAFFGAYTALSLLRHATTLASRPCSRWRAAAAVAAGCGAWATHFVAMRAFHAGTELRYATGLTSISLLVAIAAAGVSFMIATRRPLPVARAAAGALLGAGICAMHYIGMSAVAVPGFLTWDPALVALSVVAGMGFAAVALPLGLAASGQGRLAGAAGLLALGICSLHFLGMTALSLRLIGGPAPGSQSGIAPDLLAVSIALVCFIMLLLGMAALYLNRLDARRRESEQANLRSLADIAIEGLIVCDGPIVVAANRSFCEITGYAEAAVRGLSLDRLFENVPAPDPGAAGGQMSGERMVISARGEQIPVEVVGKPILYAGQPHQVLALRDLRERQKADAAIRFLAHHDSLTGLANRPSFGARLTRQLRDYAQNQKPFAVFAIDLDRFKDVNDLLGHQTGDLLLKRVAGRLLATVRDTDLVARLGGDEFAILAPCPMTGEKALALATRVVDIVGRPYVIEGKILNIGASVGLALAPDDGDDATALMKNADLALYRAKSSGRNVARRFETGMEVELQSRRSLEADLRRAIVHGQLEMHYQPLLNVRSQAIYGFEALIRWRHPTRGMISPADFIPLAEETGLIVPIGEFVLNASTQAASRWAEKITVAVNLSAVQFGGGKLVETVRAALSRSGLSPRRLELEITESVLLSDGADTLRTLHQLRDLGVRIAMDDFGTGYSSLRYLRSFPFDRIKIDRSFIQDMLKSDESAAIISAVVALSRRLGILTTAEGVETEEQMLRVAFEGCDTAQGYLIGRPTPVDQLDRFLPAPVAELT